MAINFKCNTQACSWTRSSIKTRRAISAAHNVNVSVSGGHRGGGGGGGGRGGWFSGHFASLLFKWELLGRTGLSPAVRARRAAVNGSRGHAAKIAHSLHSVGNEQWTHTHSHTHAHFTYTLHRPYSISSHCHFILAMHWSLNGTKGLQCTIKSEKRAWTCCCKMFSLQLNTPEGHD